jgi:hypothetical protein
MKGKNDTGIAFPRGSNTRFKLTENQWRFYLDSNQLVL